MRSGATRSALVAAALLAAGPAFAQDAPDRSELEEVLGHAKTAPVIPTELRPEFREVTADRLIVRGIDGQDIVIDISQKQPEQFDAFAGGRYLGFSFFGYEYYGYILIDRTAAGEDAVIETGAKPVFSPGGGYFAAVQYSGAGWGNLEGFGLWRVGPAGTSQRLFSSAFPPGDDWRIDGWPRFDCVALSAAAESSGEVAQPEAPRIHFGVEIGDRIAIQATQSDPACGGGTGSGQAGDG